MSKRIDMVGLRYGRLVVIREANERKGRDAHWICECDCGNITGPINGASLRRGFTRSCGCWRSEAVAKSKTRHTQHRTRLYKVWSGMKSRCFYPLAINYDSYGGRGITVCEEWRENFETFYEWAMANGYDPNAKRGECTIDRIDVNGNYEPSNCRWATAREQRANQRIIKE